MSSAQVHSVSVSRHDLLYVWTTHRDEHEGTRWCMQPHDISYTHRWGSTMIVWFFLNAQRIKCSKHAWCLRNYTQRSPSLTHHISLVFPCYCIGRAWYIDETNSIHIVDLLYFLFELFLLNYVKIEYLSNCLFLCLVIWFYTPTIPDFQFRAWINCTFPCNKTAFASMFWIYVNSYHK